MRQYQYKNLHHISYFPIGIFKGDTQDLLHVISSVFLTRVSKKVSKTYYSSTYFPIEFLGRLFVYNPHIILIVSKLAYDFLLSRFSHVSLRWDNIYVCYIIFSYFSLGFKEFLMAYQYIVWFLLKFFPTGFWRCFPRTIIEDDWIKITLSIQRANWSRRSVMIKFILVIN
jgi:hypothetical protein